MPIERLSLSAEVKLTLNSKIANFYSKTRVMYASFREMPYNRYCVEKLWGRLCVGHFMRKDDNKCAS